MLNRLLMGLGALGLLTAPATAQYSKSTTLEIRGVAMTPTFGIADKDRVGAKVGPGFGVGVGYALGSNLRFMADMDAGFHSSEIGDVDTWHYMGKLGYDLPTSGKVRITLNAGAGLVSIKPKGVSIGKY